MRTRRHSAALTIAAALLTAGVGAPADAGTAVGPGDGDDHDKKRCRTIQARGEGVDDGMGTTTADIFRGKRKIGTTVGTFTVTGVDEDGVASFTGTIVFTNSAGTLNAPVVGRLDTVSGEFVSTSDRVTGTGRFADVSGKLRFAGVEDLDDLTFTERVRGRLCVPKKQH